MGTIHDGSVAAFQTLLQVARASVATPPWFASPIDAVEDAEAITVTFHAPEHHGRRVEVQATDRELRVWERRPGGRRTAVRVCSLPCPIMASAIEMARSGDLLRVRLPKKLPGTLLPPASSST